MDDFSIIPVFVAFFCLPPLLFLLLAVAGAWFESKEINNEN